MSPLRYSVGPSESDLSMYTNFVSDMANGTSEEVAGTAGPGPLSLGGEAGDMVVGVTVIAPFRLKGIGEVVRRRYAEVEVDPLPLLSRPNVFRWSRVGSPDIPLCTGGGPRIQFE